MSHYTLREKLQLASWYYKDKLKRKLSLSDPKAWAPMFWNLYGQSKTESGVDVTEDTASNLSSVYAAINIISKDISTLPIELRKKQSNGKRKIINDHQSLYRLKYQANPLMPAVNYRETATSHILAWGNTYSEIVYNSVGQVQELWPITPDRVKVEYKNGTLIYWIKVDAENVPLPMDKVLHIAGLGYDGLRGYSVIRKAAESIGLSMGAEKFGARYFGANTNMGGAIKYPRAMGEKAQSNIKKSLANYTGSDASHRWMILEQGMEIEKLGFSPDESQFLQTRQFQVSEIARWFNLPPHKLKDLTRSTFSNIEEQEIEYVISCLVPWLTKIEQNYNIQLLTEKELRLGYYFKHNVKGLLRGSSDKRADYYTKLFYLGAIKPNEIRALEDMEPIDSDNADKAYIQMNLMPLDDIDKAMEQPAPDKNVPGQQVVEAVESEPEQKNIDWARGRFKLLEYRNITARDKITKRYYPLIRDAASLVVWREKVLISRLLKNKNSVRANADNLKNDIKQTYNSFGSYVYKKMHPVFRAFGDSIFNQALLEIGESVDDMPDDVILEINRYTDVYSKRHVGSSSGQLLQIIDEVSEELQLAIETRVDEWQDKRPTKIADNEAVRLGNFVAQTAFFSFGFKSYWRIRGAETCPYCRALNGRAIKSGDSFFEGGEEHEPKGAKNGPMLIRGTVMHPPLHRRCDCYISVR
jgi:HK97 family phage portal protein